MLNAPVQQVNGIWQEIFGAGCGKHKRNEESKTQTKQCLSRMKG